MENFAQNFFNFLTDKSISFSKRTFFLIGIAICVFLINDIFGFSFNYRINQKITQFRTIYELYPKTKIDTIRLTTILNEIESQIISHKPITSKISNIYQSIAENKLSQKQRIFFKRILSGTIVFILISLFALFRNKKDGLKNIYIGIIVIAIVFNCLLLLIPTFDKLIINHIMNILLSIVLFVLIGIYGNKKLRPPFEKT